ADARVRAELDHLQGMIEWRGGSLLDACTILMSGAERVAKFDPAKALRMAFHAGAAAITAGDYVRVAEAAALAERLTLREDEEGFSLADLLTGLGSLSEGKAARAVPLVLDVVARAEALDEPRWLEWASGAAALAGDESRADALHRRATALARESRSAEALIL